MFGNRVNKNSLPVPPVANENASAVEVLGVLGGTRVAPTTEFADYLE
jgi:hypothetical protein